jgi:hypothetical protein
MSVIQNVTKSESWIVGALDVEGSSSITHEDVNTMYMP